MPVCSFFFGKSFLTGFGLLLVSSSGAASFFGLPGDFLGDACGGLSVEDDAGVFLGLPGLPFGSCCDSGSASGCFGGLPLGFPGAASGAGSLSDGLVVFAFGLAGFGSAPSSLLLSPRGAIRILGCF